jgi:alpha-tubulin suppressor-like RCC1 family protein
MHGAITKPLRMMLLLAACVAALAACSSSNGSVPADGGTPPGSSSSNGDSGSGSKGGSSGGSAGTGGAATATAVSVGGNLSACAVTAGGGVRCWGGNVEGDLGVSSATTPSSSVPVQVTGLTSGVTSLSVGSQTACAVTAGGGVQCWGANDGAQLGNVSATTSSPVPVRVTGLTSGVTAVSVGANSACALTAGGGVECWGSNTFGDLGNGSTLASSPVPVPVTGLASGVTAVSVGTGTACAVTAGGGVECWGDTNFGGLQTGTTTTSSVPVQVMGLTSGATAVSMGADSACAVVAGGAQCWGDNTYGELGNGSMTTSLVPVPVTGLTGGVTAVSVGLEFACAVTAGGGVQCWGENGDGQLGNNSRTSSSVPVQVMGLTSGVTGVSAGNLSACAVTANGGVECWGGNVDGTLGNGYSISSGLPPFSDTPVPVTGF